MMARKIEHAINDKKIFELTGCLSKCDKYQYIANPKRDLKEHKEFSKQNKTNGEYKAFFVITNGRNEFREQVLWSLLH